VKGARSVITLVAVLWSVCVRANECTAPKPPKISGALCGRLFDTTGAPIPNIKLRVTDDLGSATSDTESDSKGDFIFPRLGEGKYRLTTISPGWLVEFGKFEIKSSWTTCREPVSVYLSIFCCCYGSGIVKQKTAALLSFERARLQPCRESVNKSVIPSEEDRPRSGRSSQSRDLLL